MTKNLRMGGFLEALTTTAVGRGAALALVDETQEVSYEMLLSRVSAMAVALQEAGLQSGNRVALVAENSADYVLTALAIWQADGVPVTIYPSTSATDLSLTLLDADPVLVFSDAKTETLVAAAKRDAVPSARIDGEIAIAPVATDTIPSPSGIVDTLSLICYSSGTTSRPKAIMLSSSALFNTTNTFVESWHLGPESSTLVCLPMAWLFGLTTASMSTLFAGGTVVSLKRSNPGQMAAAIQKHGVTFLPAVTTVLTKLANGLAASEEVYDLSSLKLVVSGGEPRNEQSFSLLQTFTNLPVHDNYCASEMQPLVTYDPVHDPSPRKGSAGRLVPRSELRLVDAEGNEVAPGEVGEGLSRGPGIMLGYWNDPELTAETITDDGWYRTKDLLRVDEDGYVYVVGRASDMIIRGGSNVSPAEVEAQLRQHPDVLDLAVVGGSDPMYGEEVIAVLQLRDEAELNVEEMTAFARARLSGFKVPTRFVRVNQLPQNSTTNKVNRKAVQALLTEGNLS